MDLHHIHRKCVKGLVNVSQRLTDSDSDNKEGKSLYLHNFKVPVLDNESLSELQTWNPPLVISGPVKIPHEVVLPL